jgi:putative membrane-bound dehydrogenase-like protein
MRRLVLSLALLLVPALSSAQPPKPADEGVLPVGADGKPLNLDFETGTLKDWTAEGEAFKGQPIKGDTVFARRSDNKSNHQGQYWIGGYEKLYDKPVGTLTSIAFKVTHPWASFMVGGGPHDTTCVELVRKDTNKVFFRASGLEEENLRRVVVDLKDHMGKEIFIRIVDQHTGHWGHVNFDDFRFHTEKPNFPQRPAAMPADVYKHAGLKPEEAARAMTVPEGFTVKLFAGEPDIQQPIAMCFDDRGRLWVAEAYSYPIRRNDKDAKDRILIFEDTDGDGKFDKRIVFMEGLNLVSGLEYGFGGIWIGAAPYLMFVPIKEGEDKPAGKPEILLDGWGYQDTHETLNSFIWGPDGWLYGCHGVFTHSRVGKPGTPDKDRIPINAGVWRYHPTRHVFEVFARGTSNPWGIDFNDYGDAFISACVIPHNWYIIPGGRYHRQAGADFNPYTFDDIKTIAEHRHYVGATPHGGNGKSDSVGGGHAHCGTMIYLGGAWPKEYRGKMFMGNVHGHRLNVDTLTPKGSGYTATASPDFLLANDSWARFINMRYGPDGNVYLMDWYDKQACHHGDPNIWDRTNGRIYKICWKDSKPVKALDLQKLSDSELVQLQLSENDWYVRHARRILQERAARKPLAEAIHKELLNIVKDNPDETRKLRALWSLEVIGGFTKQITGELLASKSTYVLCWLVRLRAQEFINAWPTLELKTAMKSPAFRLAAATSLPKADDFKFWMLFTRLIENTADEQDHNLPLMYWYALEPEIARFPDLGLPVLASSKIPILQSYAARRITSTAEPAGMKALVDLLAVNDDDGFLLRLLQGANEGLKGRRELRSPDRWASAFKKLSSSGNAAIRSQALAMAITFGDANAFKQLRESITDAKTDFTLRQNALQTLVAARDKELPPILQQLIVDPQLRPAALRGLAAYDDPNTPATIFKSYASFNSEAKRDALATLASRLSYARELMQAVGKKLIPATDLSADLVRQLVNYNDKSIEKQLGDFWGTVRTTPADRRKLITQWKSTLSTTEAQNADLHLGRAVFAKTCAQCHTLYGIGAKIGPEITGANRANLDYLLENILDPSAVIPKEYAATTIMLLNGRSILGIVKGETPAAMQIQTATELLTVSRSDIESVRASAVSMMPDDLLKPLKDNEIKALVAYLRHPQQVALLANAENIKDFFNGKDLTNWTGDPQLWKVENGEIVGKSPGLKKNEFLKSQFIVGDFHLKLKVKLTPNKENSGVQFRSEVTPDGDVKGAQADVGAGWWGKLYEEHGRAILWDKSGEAFVKPDEWNDYEIIAVGSKIQTYINGHLCVDLDDPKGAKRGIFAFQIHAGGALEVRFKDLQLTLDPKK